MHVYLTDRVTTKAGCPGIDLSTMWKYVRASNFIQMRDQTYCERLKRCIIKLN